MMAPTGDGGRLASLLCHGMAAYRRSFGSSAAAESLRQSLPKLHAETLPQFSPVWKHVVEAVVEARGRDAITHGDPFSILDLASGNPPEPAMSLAERFPLANVVASDHETSICQQAAVHAQHFGGRLEVQQISLQDIETFASAAAGTEEAPPSIEVITCSLGLFHRPTPGLFAGLHALLAPRGLLVATVWDRFAMHDLGLRVLGKVLGRDQPPTHDNSMEPTASRGFSPISLGHGKADPLLEAAGFRTAKGDALPDHNAVHSLRLTLGPRSADRTWQLGLLPIAGILLQLHESADGFHDIDIFARARDAFEEEVQTAGRPGSHLELDAATDEVAFAASGLQYRVLAVRRS